MAIPFASAYAPINTLNQAIQAQDQFGQNVGLQRRQIDNQMVMDTMNRILQQRAIEQQGRNQQQNYGLQQQQLANDLAYRNQALGLTGKQHDEAKRQFDAKLALDKAIADANIAQMGKPGYGMGKDYGLGLLQSVQDIDAHNASAAAAAANANTQVKAVREAYLNEVEKVKKGYAGSTVWRGLPFTNTTGDWEQVAKGKLNASLAEIMKSLGPDAAKVQFSGDPASNGEFKPVLLNPPTIPGMPQPKPQPTELPDLGPFPAGYGPPPAQSAAPTQLPSVNAFGIPRAFLNPFGNYGAPSNVRSNAPARVLTLTPDGKFVPLQ